MKRRPTCIVGRLCVRPAWTALAKKPQDRELLSGNTLLNPIMMLSSALVGGRHVMAFHRDQRPSTVLRRPLPSKRAICLSCAGSTRCRTALLDSPARSDANFS